MSELVKMTRKHYDELIEKGFSEEQVMRLTINYQSQLMQIAVLEEQMQQAEGMMDFDLDDLKDYDA